MKSVLLIIGSNGFIGKHFCKAIEPQYHTARKNAPFLLDLKNPSLKTIPTHSIRYALITAACANIAYCETHPEETYQINVAGTLKLTKLLVDQNIFPILFSSDYVFSGNEGNYREESPLAPTTIYGKQKQELENRLPAITKGNHLLLRLSKIYSLEKKDGSLLDEMATCLSQNKPIKAATDQIFCPLLIDDLINITLRLIEQGEKGLFNVGGKDKISRFQLAQKLQSALNAKKETIIPIQLNDLNPLIKRPKDTSLNSKKLFQLLDYTPLSIDLAIKTIAPHY